MNLSYETKIFIGIGLITIILVIGGVFFLGGKSGQPQELVDQAALTADASHSLGDPAAPVKIVEFADFQCPACATAQPIVKSVVEKNKDKVYFVFRHYPLPSHQNARIAAQACEAAGIQGKFWEMHDLLFTNQSAWSESSNAKEIFTDYASQLGLNVDQFKDDLGKVNDSINKDYTLGNQAGIDSTPTFFINGKKYPGVIQADEFQSIIDQATS